jgi:hypothetical protein
MIQLSPYDHNVVPQCLLIAVWHRSLPTTQRAAKPPGHLQASERDMLKGGATRFKVDHQPQVPSVH